jgi:hypothetical protein
MEPRRDSTFAVKPTTAMEPAAGVNSFGVLEKMADLMLMRRVLEPIRSDNGAEKTLALRS